MRIVRVDDRLIHGQVVAGWARPLGINILIIASNTLSTDKWACNAYRLAIPESIDFFCINIHDCISLVARHKNRNHMIIIESVHEAYQLVQAGLETEEVIIGGLSYREGTREIAPYIFLSPEDIEGVVRLFQMGIKVVGKPLPNSVSIDVVKNLAGVT